MSRQPSKRYIGDRVFVTPQSAFRAQLRLTLSVTLALGLLCTAGGVVRSARIVIAGGKADLSSAFSAWASWILGPGAWWLGLVCAGLFVTVQVVSTPQLRSAGSTVDDFRNRFAVVMQAAAAVTSGSWILACGVIITQYLAVDVQGEEPLSAPMLFTGSAAALCFYLGAELKMHYGADRLRGLLRSYAATRIEIGARNQDLPHVSRERPGTMILFAIFATFVLCLALGVGIGAAFAQAHAAPYPVLITMISTALLGLAYSTSYFAHAASLCLSHRFETVLAGIMSITTSAFAAFVAGWLVRPITGITRWQFLTIILFMFVASLTLNYATYRVARAHRISASPLRWLAPGAILVLDSALSRKRRNSLELEITKERRRLVQG